MKRCAEIKRKTTETDIYLSLNIDGKGSCQVSTPVHFLNHMIELMTRHGFFDIELKADGDVEIDFHHTVEDIGICLGQAFKEAVRDKKGIKRYGRASVPMDEALADISLDFSGRPFLVFNADISAEKVGDFDTALVEEFFHAFTGNAGITLHIDLIRGTNPHHCIEAIFKAFGKAMEIATSIDKRIEGVFSTKGKL